MHFLQPAAGLWSWDPFTCWPAQPSWLTFQCIITCSGQKPFLWQCPLLIFTPWIWMFLPFPMHTPAIRSQRLTFRFEWEGYGLQVQACLTEQLASLPLSEIQPLTLGIEGKGFSYPSNFWFPQESRVPAKCFSMAKQCLWAALSSLWQQWPGNGTAIKLSDPLITVWMFVIAAFTEIMDLPWTFVHCCSRVR